MSQLHLYISGIALFSQNLRTLPKRFFLKKSLLPMERSNKWPNISQSLQFLLLLLHKGIKAVSSHPCISCITLRLCIFLFQRTGVVQQNHQILTVRILEDYLLPNLGEVKSTIRDRREKKKPQQTNKGRIKLHYIKESYSQLFS